METCSKGHDITGPDNIDKDGRCRQCLRNNVNNYQRRLRAGRVLVDAAEGRGITIEQARDVLQKISYQTLRELTLV